MGGGQMKGTEGARIASEERAVLNSCGDAGVIGLPADKLGQGR